MAISLKELRRRIKNIESKLDEAQKRLPAHSVKPTIMQEIFRLEDELEQLHKHIKEREK